MSNKLPTLDQLAMQHAQKTIEKTNAVKTKKWANAVENLLTKTLGVLQEQGVYASLLFLFSRKSDDHIIAEKLLPVIYDLTEKLPFGWNVDRVDVQSTLKFYANTVSDNLDKLLLTKEVYEQMLIYARFSAKAAAIEAESKEGGKES